MGRISADLSECTEGFREGSWTSKSIFEMYFYPDKEKFIANANKTCCKEVRFVQIFYMNSPTKLNKLPNRKWTIDADPPPYYPLGSFPDPIHADSDMDDTAGTKPSRWYVPGSVWSQDFETCAVCSESKLSSREGVGDVFGCIRWGHRFQFQGDPFSRYVSKWRRWIEGKSKSNHRFRTVRYGPEQGKAPSEVMKWFLDKYFP